MDYEKKYKEALKWMHELYPGLHGATKEDAEHYFPELRESEDEKIRRTLVEYFGPKAQLEFVRGVPIQKIRDWLEKQKENPKSSDSIPSDCTSDAKFEDRWHEVADSLPDNGREVLAKDKFGNTLLARYDGEGWDVSVYDDEDYRCHNGISKWREIPSEKQKEQKPNIEICPHSVKSKSYSETGYPIEDCDYGLEIALNILEETLGKVQGFQTDDGIREHQTAIKAVKDAMKEQKPTEWSEDDERMRKSCLWVIEHQKSYTGVDDEKAWLKSIPERFNLQPKQEWSEEDERMRNQLIYDIEHHKKDGLISAKQNKATKALYNGIEKCYDEKIAWLKSLRPVSKESLQSWKPSEEQMKALKSAQLMYAHSLGREETAVVLASLYEQLKKLI